MLFLFAQVLGLLSVGLTPPPSTTEVKDTFTNNDIKIVESFQKPSWSFLVTVHIFLWNISMESEFWETSSHLNTQEGILLVLFSVDTSVFVMFLSIYLHMHARTHKHMSQTHHRRMLEPAVTAAIWWWATGWEQTGWASELQRHEHRVTLNSSPYHSVLLCPLHPPPTATEILVLYSTLSLDVVTFLRNMNVNNCPAVHTITGWTFVASWCLEAVFCCTGNDVCCVYHLFGITLHGQQELSNKDSFLSYYL